MTIVFDVKKVTLVTGPTGPDAVFLYVAYPSPTPGLTQGPLCLSFDVAAGSGFDYVTKTLGIPAASVQWAGR